MINTAQALMINTARQRVRPTAAAAPSAPDGARVLAATRNFRFHWVAGDAMDAVTPAQLRAAAARAVVACADTRAAVARRWLGAPLPAWPEPCEVYLYASARQYGQQGGSNAGSDGYMTCMVEGGRVLARRIDVQSGHPYLFEDALPHEVAHATLAGPLPVNLPPWADEGLAMLAESRPSRAECREDVRRAAAAGKLFTPDGLLALGRGDLLGLDAADGPQRRRRLFYCQSMVLVEYLDRRRGSRGFLDFLAAGGRGTVEKALRDHYGSRTVDLGDVWEPAGEFLKSSEEADWAILRPGSRGDKR